MQAIDFILNDAWARDAMIGSVIIATLCSILSIIVVLKRMAFIGQGISHAAFGGVGTASLFGLAGMARDGLVLVFCLAVAWLIAILSRRRKIEQDTAIGILLVFAMAWGAIAEKLSYDMNAYAWYRNLIGPRQTTQSFEDILFGSIITVSSTWLWVCAVVTAIILIFMAIFHRQLLFFTFDEESSRVYGVRANWLHMILLAIMTLAVVMTMRLAGVILTSALLVLPAATALALSRSLVPVVLLSLAVGIGGATLGLLISLEWGNLPPGPCMVLVLALMFAAATLIQRLRSRSV